MGGLNNKYVNVDLKWSVYQPVFSVINILVIPPFITLTIASNWNQPFQQQFSASNILSHSFMVSLVG